jgi:putative DNA-invertase from lambdoid prophage Rac
MLDVIHTIDSLIGRGVTVTVLGLGKLDNSPQSRLTLAMLSAISEFERSLISERTKAKLAQLKADGVKLGRPVKINDEALKSKAKELFSSGLSWRKVAGELDIALSTLQRLMKNDQSAQPA